MALVTLRSLLLGCLALLLLTFLQHVVLVGLAPTASDVRARQDTRQSGGGGGGGLFERVLVATPITPASSLSFTSVSSSPSPLLPSSVSTGRVSSSSAPSSIITYDLTERPFRTSSSHSESIPPVSLPPPISSFPSDQEDDQDANIVKWRTTFEMSPPEDTPMIGLISPMNAHDMGGEPLVTIERMARVFAFESKLTDSHAKECNNAIGFPVIQTYSDTVMCEPVAPDYQTHETQTSTLTTTATTTTTPGTEMVTPPSLDVNAEVWERAVQFVSPRVMRKQSQTVQAGGTELRCFDLSRRGTADRNEHLCHGWNVFVDFTKLRVAKETDEWLQYHPGVMGGACTMTKAMKGTKWKFSNIDYFKDWEAHSSPTWHPECDMRVDHPVLFLTRNGNRHPAFVYQDFFDVWFAMEIFREKYGDMNHPDEVQLILMDRSDDGPFAELWRKTFGRRYPILRGEHLMRRGWKGCFRRAVFILPGTCSLLNKDVGKKNTCSNSQLMLVWADYMKRALGIHDKVRQRDDPIIVSLITRKNYGDRVKFPAPIGRLLKNQDEVIQVLQNTPGLEVREIDFSRYLNNGTTQLMTMTDVDVLIAVHGAGLAHMIFLPESAVVAEMFPRSMYQARYRNWAQWFGKGYVDFRGGKASASKPRPDVSKTNPNWHADLTLNLDEFREDVLKPSLAKFRSLTQ